MTQTKDLAHFLAKMNQQKQHHIGYCGDNEAEIMDTLLHDFSELPLGESFFTAYEKGKLIGAIGLDIDLEEKSAEVWGPFTDNKETLDSLWNRICLHHDSTLNKVYFFINEENNQALTFMKKINAEHKSQHYILKAEKGENNETHLVIPYAHHYQEAFSRLHEQAFPNTYYSANEILDKLNEYNQLLLVPAEDEQIKGYVYIEALPDHGEGNIEFISASPRFRRQGIGTLLLKAALSALFQHKEILTVSLCVGADNQMALSLYKAAGFKIAHELQLFEGKIIHV
ncbi:GNAT family N-acetyltransferase [Cytobacillus purgationiresistens]|uniref:Ribosomal protein S18 acetylase RimI-like enzyme n=1 Tax=Cytobacillus purgationiresistens TaxID=863449 RepID=A0ABU0ARQ1_9BACI|nr:N-acetyltransferase [Cytobacillus purgationiresistens]MDQ0273544.1 ribosomal protein S18 acetylase RimI-like enzyme [Cytobacillus purgationiresistens]